MISYLKVLSAEKIQHLPLAFWLVILPVFRSTEKFMGSLRAAT